MQKRKRRCKIFAIGVFILTYIECACTLNAAVFFPLFFFFYVKWSYKIWRVQIFVSCALCRVSGNSVTRCARRPAWEQRSSISFQTTTWNFEMSMKKEWQSTEFVPQFRAWSRLSVFFHWCFDDSRGCLKNIGALLLFGLRCVLPAHREGAASCRTPCVRVCDEVSLRNQESCHVSWFNYESIRGIARRATNVQSPLN